MARVAPNLPAESDLLCESCGYTLNGLPANARCPECGEPVQASIEDGRGPSAWERGGKRPGASAFLSTTLNVLLRPTHFFRHLTVRNQVEEAWTFGALHLGMTSVVFGLIAVGYGSLVGGEPSLLSLISTLVISIFVVPIILSQLTKFAAALTHWEATYRGLRLPRSAVNKCLYYHYAHYLPVALLLLGTTVVFRAAAIGHVPGIPNAQAGIWYLYVLAAEVVLSAAYLFWTYWIAMRNVMYANR